MSHQSSFHHLAMVHNAALVVLEDDAGWDIFQRAFSELYAELKHRLQITDVQMAWGLAATVRSRTYSKRNGR